MLKREIDRLNNEYQDVREVQPDLQFVYETQMPSSIAENKYNLLDEDFAAFQKKHL